MERETAIIEGPAGWGEFAPFLEYGPEEASSWLLCALEAAWVGFPRARRQEIPLNSTVPAIAAKDVRAVLGRYSGTIREVKVKVAERGQTLADDLARLRAVREVLPEARLKVDANGGWSESEAVRALVEFEEFKLLYAEQPVSTVEGLARVREQIRARGVSTLIAADESVRKASDPLRVARLGAADLLIIKAAPLGGVRRALSVVEAAGLPAVVSSALETSVGIRAGAALAASLPQLPYGCGLGTVSLLKGDVVHDSLVAQDGVLRICDVTPDERLVERWRAGGERELWWRGRIEQAYLVLTTGS